MLILKIFHLVIIKNYKVKNYFTNFGTFPERLE